METKVLILFDLYVTFHTAYHPVLSNILSLASMAPFSWVFLTTLAFPSESPSPLLWDLIPPRPSTQITLHSWADLIFDFSISYSADNLHTYNSRPELSLGSSVIYPIRSRHLYLHAQSYFIQLTKNRSSSSPIRFLFSIPFLHQWIYHLSHAVQKLGCHPWLRFMCHTPSQ